MQSLIKQAFTFRHWGLHNKLTFILLISSLIPVLIIASYSYTKASASYEDSALMVDQQHLKLATSAIDNSLVRVPQDLTFLEEFHALQQYLLWHDIGEEQESNRWLKNTTNGFQSFMQTNAMYMQLRVLDTEGWEVIRINRDNNGNVSLSHQQDLQRKHQSDYFIETMKLPDNRYYVSKLNLNREHGEIQQPFTPVIRYALPMIDQNGKRHGIIILNVFAEQFLGAVSALTDIDDQQGDAFFVINQDGYFLLHPQIEKTFGFELSHASNITDHHNMLWQALQKGNTSSFITQQTAYAIDKVYPLPQNKEQFWYIFHAVPQDVLLAELSSFQLVFFSLLLVLLCLLIVLSKPLIRMLVNPVRQVTANLQRLERGETSLQPIHYAAHDELREMVDAASGLGQRIVDAISLADNISKGDYRSEIKPLSEHDALGIALHNMTQTLRDVTALVEAISTGDLSHNIQSKGQYDVLSQSLIQMVETLRGTVAQANTIAEGDYRADIIPRSKHDTLGIALQDMTQTLRNVSHVASSLAKGDFNQTVEIKSEYDQLGKSVAHMTQVLKKNATMDKKQNWLKSNVASIGLTIQNHPNTQALAQSIMQIMPEQLHASHGAFYVMHEDEAQLFLEGSYAFQERKNISNHFKIGEGLVGQCALEQQTIILSQVPDDYIKIQSGLGESSPNQIIVSPLIAEDKLMGVIELATLGEFSTIHKDLLEQVSGSIALSIYTVQASQQTSNLLKASQSMTSELKEQQTELHQANATLEAKANELKASEGQLQSQQEALQRNNNELLVKNELVEEQKANLEAARHDLENKARELSDSSKYKSEFLANMSHELRTPMNSIIGFTSRVLKKSADVLPERQLKNLHTVQRNANHLLSLINSLLDISKIEAGKMDVYPEVFSLAQLTQDVIELTQALVDAKHLTIAMEIDASISVFNDKTKLKQVFINLISNAIKFTNHGGLTLKAHVLNQADNASLGLEQDRDYLEIRVVDTGVGMNQDSLDYIFEAFRQVDGSNTRSYGGTGLGLNISSRFCQLMHGNITAESQEGVGSSFIVHIPMAYEIEKAGPKPLQITELKELKEISQKLGHHKTTCVLCIDDNSEVLELFQEYLNDAGFYCITAQSGQEGLKLAKEVKPLAIILDVQMPYMDGWTVLRTLKEDPHTAHIPVLMATMMDNKALAHQLGAFAYLEKPVLADTLVNCIQSVPQQVRHVLVVDDEEAVCDLMEEMLTEHGMRVDIAHNGELAIQALEAMGEALPDMIILDLMMPKMNGFEVLEALSKVEAWAKIAVIVSTAKILSPEEEELLALRTKAVLQKGGDNLDNILGELQVTPQMDKVEKMEEKI